MIFYITSTPEETMEPVKPHSSPVAYRRQRQIEDCLFANLLHTPYASISVADICRQVGISRKAFYNYYHDKDVCLCALINRVIQNTMIHVTAMAGDNPSALEVSTLLLEHWKEQKSFWDIIVRNQLLQFLMFQYMQYIQTEDRSLLDLLSTPDVKSDTDILCCYVSCQITLILQWYLRDFDTPTKEMARKLMRLMHSPLIPVQKEG